MCVCARAHVGIDQARASGGSGATARRQAAMAVRLHAVGPRARGAAQGGDGADLLLLLGVEES